MPTKLAKDSKESIVLNELDEKLFELIRQFNERDPGNYHEEWGLNIAAVFVKFAVAQVTAIFGPVVAMLALCSMVQHYVKEFDEPDEDKEHVAH
jgi:hypothetical protein